MKLSAIYVFAFLASPLAVLSAPMPQSTAVATLDSTVPAADFGRVPRPAAPKAKAPTAARPATRPATRPGAAPATKARVPAAKPAAGGPIPTAAELIAAANAWRADTMKVSHYLNNAATMTGPALQAAAYAANVAEKNELVHKAVIDRHPISKTPAVLNANNMLVTQGHFQAVVDALTDVTNLGSRSRSANPAVINANRCPNVLFAIDAYLRAADQAAGGGVAQPSAVRPVACGGPQQ
ncbi:hypothetical protein HKX48_005195 [Thoreauomyces humboldtii]|nr:hypothetical protein HKX48_005195 [Thoreauomyces humboldtii]